MRGNEDQALARARAFSSACGHRPDAWDELLELGRMARVLSASKPGGLLLVVEVPELSFFLADGMAVTSQLISVNSDPGEHGALKELLGDDIRISVHSQRPAEFLGDVRDHRFDLIVFGKLEPAATTLAASRLAPGGLLAACGQAPRGGDDARELEQMLMECGLLVTTGGRRWLIAARPADKPEAKRRGGRRRRPRARG